MQYINTDSCTVVFIYVLSPYPSHPLLPRLPVPRALYENGNEIETTGNESGIITRLYDFMLVECWLNLEIIKYRGIIVLDDSALATCARKFKAGETPAKRWSTLRRCLSGLRCDLVNG